MTRATRALLLLCSATGALGCKTNSATAPTDPELVSLDVEGNHALKKKTIVEKLGTAATSWIPFSDKHYLDLAVLESDKKRIKRVYEDHGEAPQGHVRAAR